jgi:DNA-binding NarL/FixJ family response regulator
VNKILVALFDSRSNIILEGIEAMLILKEDFSVTGKFLSADDLLTSIKTVLPNVLILCVYKSDRNGMDLLKKIGLEYPRIKVLALSVEYDEETVFKTLKAGAKGFITNTSNRQELYDAIHHLRNGYDYYTKSITDILLKSYIKVIKSEEDGKPKNLSKREVEIIKCWGDGFTNQEIADKLFISVRTVESHKNHIMQKLNLRTTVDLVKFAIKNNIIQV